VQLAVFVGEWVKRIPDFELAAGFTPTLRRDGKQKLASPPLTWKPQ
jgi:hypothetical protein